MKIIHISDSHLGYTAYRRLDPETGVNQREEDVSRAFQEAIDKIIEIKPDVVLHSGDLFDSVRPSNRVTTFAIRQLLRLVGENIPVVIISGNHSTPRRRGTGSILSLFGFFPPLRPVYRGAYERIKIGDLMVHAIPQCPSSAQLEQELKKVEIDRESRYNILMLHAAVAGLREFSMHEFNEQEVATSYLDSNFSYIALGHYHKFTRIQHNAYYAGSLERFSFNEVGQEKGFLEIDLDKRPLQPIFHRLESPRLMIDLPDIAGKFMSTSDLMKAIERAIDENDPTGKIMRLTINNIRTPLYNSLDFGRIRRLTSSAIHFELRYRRLEDDSERVQSSYSAIGQLDQEFTSYLARVQLEGLDRERLKELGLKYLGEAKNRDKGE